MRTCARVPDFLVCPPAHPSCRRPRRARRRRPPAPLSELNLVESRHFSRVPTGNYVNESLREQANPNINAASGGVLLASKLLSV